MRITLNLDAQLLAEAKALAARQHVSLAQLIEEGLRLRTNAGGGQRHRVDLPVVRGQGGLMPGVDPLRNKALFLALGEDA